MIAARGFCMGCADVVPGVSGGTMAFILGIYEELIESIKVLASKEMLTALFSFNLKKVFEIAPWKFLGSLFLGIGIAVVSLAKFLEWALKEHPELLWSFFFGLVLASIFAVAKRKTAWTPASVTAIVLGTIAAYIIVGLVPLQTPDAAWFLFLSGAIAICAMILPGISGSFLLVIMGKYETILGAVNGISTSFLSVIRGKYETILGAFNGKDFMVLGAVAAGCVVGILTFSQILSWLFKHFHNLTISVLIGLMIGSLRKIWPWKNTLESIMDRHGELKPVVQENILPPAYGGEFAFALTLAVVGIALVLILDRIANKGVGPQRVE
ncbi:MAG: DUF368 domain-containing protein [Candidatus Omnitrophica bacterium]|nr:DUF368 domain-containing protein [Candidatus Omnitrophota bacterium]